MIVRPARRWYNREDSKFSGRAGLIYNFANGLAPYVAYATSYDPIIGLNASNQLLLPETGEQAEIGVKYQPAGFDGHFSIAVFDLKRQNVLDDRSQWHTTNLQNQTGEVTSRGLELEAVANLAPGLKMVGSFTTYDLFTSQDADPALIGQIPTNTPQQTGIASGRTTRSRRALRGFGFGGGVRYVGESFADTANTLVVPSVVLGDAAVHYEWQNWRSAVNVNNVADKIYVASCSTANVLLLRRSPPRDRRASATSGSERNDDRRRPTPPPLPFSPPPESPNRPHLVGDPQLDQPYLDGVPAAAVHHRPAVDLPSRDRRGARL